MNQRQNPRARTQARLPSRETAPVIQSRLQQRRIAPEANPLQGLSEGTTRIGWRMNQLGAELSQQFGRMGTNFQNAMNIEAEREIQHAQDQRQGLIAQAQIDHLRGTPNSSEARSYTMERERLRLGQSVADTQRTVANDRMDQEIAGAGGAAPRGAPGGGLRNTAAARQAYSFFVGRGYNPAQASAIVGHLNAESSWRTDARNPGDGRDGSDSIGMLQWNSSRATALQAFARQQGRDWRDMNVQLAYLDHEIRNTRFAFANDRTRQAFMSATTVEAASSAFMHAVRPAGYTPGNPQGGHNFAYRLQGARTAMGFGGAGGAAPAGPAATPQEMQAPGSATGDPGTVPPSQRTLDVNTPQQVRRNLQTAREAAAGGTGTAVSRIAPGQGITDTLADQAVSEIAQSYATEVLPKVTLDQGFAGSTRALNDHALQVMKGLDANQQGAILAKLEDRTRTLRFRHFEGLQTQQLTNNRSTFDNETARSFLDGGITSPEHVQQLVTRAQDPMIYGDARVARQTVSKTLIDTATQDMQANPANAQQTYLRAMQALEPMFTQFPADMGALRGNLLQQLDRANGTAGRQIVSRLGEAAARGDANAVVTTLFENYGTLQQPQLANAAGKALEALGTITEQRATAANAAAFIEGRTTVGPVDQKAVEEEVGNRFAAASRSNDPAAVHQVITEAPVIPAAVRQQMSLGFRPNALQAQAWKFDPETKEMSGAGVSEFNQRFGLLNGLQQAARERVLDPEALAVFNATNQMSTALGMTPATAYQKVIERQRSMNPTEFQRITREGLRLDEVYEKKGQRTVDDQFEAHLSEAARNAGGSGFYGGFWQKLSGGTRCNALTIDGEPVAELDYGSMQPRLALTLSGIHVDPGTDLYLVPGYERYRDDFKGLLVSALAALQPLTRYPQKVAMGLRGILRATEALGLVVAQHPGLWPWLGHGRALDLMRTESDIAIRVILEANRRGFVVLPIHDSFLVPRSRMEETRTLMIEAFQVVTGTRVEPRISLKAPPAFASASSSQTMARAPVLPVGNTCSSPL